MSTEHVPILIVGNYASDIYSSAKAVAQELGKEFSHETSTDYLNFCLGDGYWYKGDCGFAGLALLEDYQSIDIEEDGLSQEGTMRLLELKEQFEEATGVIARVKPVVWTY